MTTLLYPEALTLNASLPGPDNPFPIFRNRQWDREVALVGTVAEPLRRGLGKGAGHRVLPYGRQERYSRKRAPTALQSLVMENGRLRAVFLPQLGARLYSLVDKESGREILHRNPCIQMGNLALRDAWFAGGIEWNIGQFGHACHTASPVFAAGVRYPDGAQGLRIGEFERMKGLFWQIDFRLDESLPVLWAHTRVRNPLEHPLDMYWWTNIAVAQRRGGRVLSSADKAFCLVPNPGGPTAFSEARLPMLPGLKGLDATYPENYQNASEFFFLCDGGENPWEAVVEEDGGGFFECATPPLSYRKLFVWGTHPGGARWQRFLAPEGGEPYLEIQAGLAPSQLHTFEMPRETTWTWTEAFGPFSVPRGGAHLKDWAAARAHTGRAIQGRLPPSLLAEQAALGARLSQTPANEIFSKGASWGWLEKSRLARMGKPDPSPGLEFPAPSGGDPAEPWRRLLEQGELPPGPEARYAGSWMVQAEWKEMLERSLLEPGGSHAQAWNAYAVFCVESGRESEAEAAFRKSYERAPTQTAARNLAALAFRGGATSEAAHWYREALAFEPIPLELAREGIEFLVNEEGGAGLAEAEGLLARLPPALLDDDRVVILRARCLKEKGDHAGVLALLNRDFACVREGEVILSELWVWAHGTALAKERGVPLSAALLAEAESRFPVPLQLDFRLNG